MIPISAARAQPRGDALREDDPVVRRYRALFRLVDWSGVPERDPTRPWPGPVPQPRQAFIKALLVKLQERKPYLTELRAFLVEHPGLVLELGFRPVPDPTHPYGFDVERTVPCVRWLRAQQRTVDATVLTALLQGTVAALRAEIPGLGQTVAYDVKHIYAWVQENNPKAYVAHRFDPQRQPPGDPDCRLGVKRRSNQTQPDGTQTGPAETLWGYGTGVAAATVPGYGDVVLAEGTQPFNENDVTYFRPLYAHTVAALGHAPRNLTADAAFDAWYVYEPAAQQGGIAAIPLNLRGQAPPNRDEAGVPRCAQGHAMRPRGRFTHEDGYPAQRFGCPRRGPAGTPACAHPRFGKAGCTRVVNLSAGGQMRVQLDRTSPAYAALYRQRTAAERINSQAVALGIERPRVRNSASVWHLNTLTYILINVRALQRLRTRHAQQAPAA